MHKRKRSWLPTRYMCHKCHKWMDADDAVWVVPSTGEASTGDGSKPFHVKCCPPDQSDPRPPLKLSSKMLIISLGDDGKAMNELKERTFRNART